VLKSDRNVSYQQCLFPHDRLLASVAEMADLFGDEVWHHLEFIRFGGRGTAAATSASTPTRSASRPRSTPTACSTPARCAVTCLRAHERSPPLSPSASRELPRRGAARPTQALSRIVRAQPPGRRGVDCSARPPGARQAAGSGPRAKGMSSLTKIPPGVGPKYPQVLTLVGGSGDLAQRKLWPGLFHLVTSGFIPSCRMVGVSLDPLDVEGFRALVHGALEKFSPRKATEEAWRQFAPLIDYVPISAGAGALRDAVNKAEAELGPNTSRLHYLSVPPNAALPAVKMLADANLIERSRVIMEKPFGVDLESAVELNRRLHEVFNEDQIYRNDHFLGKEPAQNI